MCRVYGVTATPNRGDRKGLRPVFSNVADQIRIGELIASGHLVPPRTFVIDVGVQEQLAQGAPQAGDDFDMGEVDAIMNQAPITEAVIRHWQEKAGDRQTVVFCSTVDHARNVAVAFSAAGVAGAESTATCRADERKAALDAYAAGEVRVIVNVAVLTEGWDHPPTSCVVLLRPSSYKSTMIQMVGRGPAHRRSGGASRASSRPTASCSTSARSSLMHGSLEQDVDLDGRERDGDAPTKDCPDCRRQVPLAATRVPALRSSFVGAARRTTKPGAALRLRDDGDRPPERSSFRWCDLFGDDAR